MPGTACAAATDPATRVNALAGASVAPESRYSYADCLCFLPHERFAHINNDLRSKRYELKRCLRYTPKFFGMQVLPERTADYMDDDINLGSSDPSDQPKVDKNKRRTLIGVTGAVGAVAGIGAATPFVMSMFPSERARAAGAPVEVDIGNIEPGMMITEAWRGKPVWILHRTVEMIEAVRQSDDKVADPDSRLPMQPDYAKNELRSIKPDYLILVGICTHLGCSPSQKFEPGEASGLGAEWLGGFFCPCHGSRFDLAGRVYKGAPAPANLDVPPHTYLTETRVLIGEDRKGA